MKTKNNQEQPLIDAYFVIKINFTKQLGYHLHRISLECTSGRNQIIDDLLTVNYLNNFHPANHPDPDGYFSSTVEYHSEQYGLALLKFYGNVQQKNHGVVKSTIANNDCMLYDQIKPNKFVIYVFNGKAREEHRYFSMLENGDLDSEIAHIAI